MLLLETIVCFIIHYITTDTSLKEVSLSQASRTKVGVENNQQSTQLTQLTITQLLN